jgi:hypothetical protein
MATYRREAEYRRFARLRSDSYAATTKALLREIAIPFALHSIESRALRTWRTEWSPRHTNARDVGEWNWDVLASDYLRRPSASHRRLTVQYVEGCPDPTHPLKGQILSLDLAAATAYAHALGSTTLRLADPAPALIEDYVSAGFGLVYLGRAVRYCERRIR